MEMKNLIKIIYLIGMCLACLLGCQKEVIKIQPQLKYQGINTTEYGDYIPDLNDDILRSGTPHYIGGTHFFWPSYPNYPTTQEGGYITFDSDAEYDFNDPLEQGDFNKLFGLRKALIGTSTKNSCMIGWRWSVLRNKLEYTPYINDMDGGMYFFTDQQIIDEQLNSPLNVSIYFEVKNLYDRFEVTIGDRFYSFNKVDYNVRLFTNSFWVNSWFGGTMTAPHDIHVSQN